MDSPLDIVSQLPTEALKALSNLASMEIQNRELVQTLGDLPQQLPDLKIPSYILLTFVEHLYSCFIEELFNNYDEDGDYSTDPAEVYTNSNTIKITNSFNDLDFKDGQFPKIVIQAQGSNPNNQFVGMDSPYKSQNNSFSDVDRDEKSSYFQVPVAINIMTGNYNEANILGNLIQMTLLENSDIIRKLFGFNYVTEPNFTGARLLKPYDKVFVSTISFVSGKYVQWANLIKQKNYKAIIYRLVAKVGKNDPDDSINHFIQIINDMPLDPELKAYIQLKYGGDS